MRRAPSRGGARPGFRVSDRAVTPAATTPRARPRPGLVLGGHIVFTLVNTVLFSNAVWLVTLLVRLHFGSADAATKDWQTTLVTAAVPTCFLLSIFWHELLRRVTLRTYLAVFWLVAVLPLGCIAFVRNYEQLLGCHLIATIGFAGWAPVNGKLLKSFYDDAVRGRMYAVLNVVALGGGIAAVYVVGRWMEAAPEAFRPYFVASAVLQIAGLALLVRLARLTGTADEPAPAEPWRAAVLRPLHNMHAILRTDRRFRRYEIAFMNYGAAFMICEALLPVLTTARLGMRYEEYAHMTQVATKVAMLALMLPMGWLLDRIGPMRTSAVAFAGLSAYPLLLLAATGPWGIAAASGVFGFGMAGVMMGWMLGPVILAGRAADVPQYVAIHATLVGVRGVIFQGAGMGLYQLTGSFTWPFLAAAVAFFWAAVQMWRLHRDLPTEGRPAPPSEASPADAVLATEGAAENR